MAGDNARAWPAIGQTAVLTVYWALFVDVLQLAFLIPLFRSIVDAVEPDRELVPTRIGQVSSIAALVETIMSPMSGAMSDYFGRRRMMMVSTLGSSMSAFTLARSRTFGHVITGRVVNSLSGSSASIAQAFIADVTTQAERPDYMILVTALIGVAFTIGPFIGGGLNSRFGLGITCYVSTILAFINFLLVIAFMKESRSRPEVAPPVAPRAEGAQASGAAGAAGSQQTGVIAEESASRPGCLGRFCRGLCHGLSPMIWVLFTASMFVSPLSVVFEVCANVYITDKFCGGDRDKGARLFSNNYSCIGISLLVMPLVFYKPLKEAVGFTGTIVLGGITGSLGLMLNAVAPTQELFLAGTMLWAVGFQLLGPAVPVLITRLAAPTAFGKAFGLYRSFGNMGRVIAPIMVGPIFRFSRPLVFFFMAGGVIIMACILYLVATVSGHPIQPVEAEEGKEPSELGLEEPEAELKRNLFGRQGSVASDTDLIQFGNLEGQVLTLGTKNMRRLMRRSVSEEFPRSARPMLVESSATEMSKTFHP
mmetsp:Transcript_42127/g.119160  ORF Transcript_42127/g.119160 Transcript_42127/m.119160 type:complete len:535 (-) Transcript_42127:136-1740(-)